MVQDFFHFISFVLFDEFLFLTVAAIAVVFFVVWIYGLVGVARQTIRLINDPTRIAELERENERLRAELGQKKN